MGQAEIISLDHLRATHHLSQLRQRLHECFDQWLDVLEPYLDDKPMSLSDLRSDGTVASRAHGEIDRNPH
jgi:hypothetical protein